MKIILSTAGGGKTSKVAELAAKYTEEEEKRVHVILGEVSTDEFIRIADRLKVNVGRVFATESNSLEEIAGIIENDTVSEVFFIDEYINLYNADDDEYASYQDTMKKLLSEFQRLEEESGRKFYITQQARYGDVRLNGEKLVMFDYESAQ